MIKFNRFVIFFLSIVLLLGLVSVYPVTNVSASSPLKERAPVAYIPKTSQAFVVNSDWLQIELIDQKYNNSHVTNTSYYTITSGDDTDFTVGVNPSTAHYRYFAESAPFIPNLTSDIGKVENTYNVFLKLPSNKKLKEGKSYTVTINTAVVTAGPFNFAFDLAHPNLVIHSNQVGYLAEGNKVAYMSLWTGQGEVEFGSISEFNVRDAATHQLVYTGNITLSTANDRWSQSDIYAMDFTAFKGEGSYYLYVPTVGRSYPFKISSSIYKDEIAYTVIRGMTMQRDGDHGLDDPSVTHWNRPNAHMDDAIDQALYLSNGNNLEAARVDLTGGHMDAGDRGKYPYNSAWTSAILLTAATYYPEQIKALDESLNLPESDNGKPDFLDELVYELEWLYKAVMNTSKDGTLPNYLRPGNPTASEGGYEQGQPLEGLTNRVIYNSTMGPNKAETLLAVGALATAFNTPIMQEYYPVEAAKYLVAAQRAYNGFMLHYEDSSYLKEATDYDVFKDGFTNTWSDEMLFAASSLLQATGDAAEYEPWINSELPINMADYSSMMHWSWVTASPMIPTLASMYRNTHLSTELREWAYDGILAYANKEMNHEQPFGGNMQDEGFPNAIGWRFASSNLFPIVIGYALTGNANYLKKIQTTWDYELGTNAVSRTFVTGLGDPQREPRWFVNEINQYQYVQYANNNGGWAEPAPGIPHSDLQSSGFPWWYDDAHNTAAKDDIYPAYASYPPAYRYVDSWNTQNEFVIVNLANNAASMLPLIPTQLYDLTIESENGHVIPAGGSYSDGVVVPLMATGELGYKFDRWEGAVTGTQNPTTITMDANKAVTAVFAATPTYTLTKTAENGAIQTDLAGNTFNEDTSVKLTAIPEYGYRFIGWSGDLDGTVNPITLTMDANKQVTANFELLASYTLEVFAEGGSVSVIPDKDEYLLGEEVILTPTPNLGYAFGSWSGDATGSSNPLSVIISDNTQITANYNAVPVYTLTMNTTVGGSVTPASGSYTTGDIATLTATPLEGYMFTGWTGALSGTQNPAPVTMTENKTITANFAFRGGIIGLDVGDTMAGTTSINNGIYSISGSGGGLGTAPDKYRFVFEELTQNNFEISAKLDNITGTSNAMAGLLIRKALDDGASGSNPQFINVFVKDGALNVRSRAGGTGFDNLTIIPATPFIVDGHVWIKLTRTNNPTFNVYASVDGTNWVKLVDEVLLWGFDTVGSYAGMFVSSGSTSTLAAATFSDVKWPTAPKLPVPVNAPYTSVNIGSGVTSGSTTVDFIDPSILTVSTNSGEVWGDHDSFRYIYFDSSEENQEFVAKLESFTGGNGDAAAGVMVRRTVADNSENTGVSVLKTASYHQYRKNVWTSRGTQSADIAPLWIKVNKTKSGSDAVVESFTSVNGTDWTSRGTTSYSNWDANYTIGLFVSAGHNSQNATAVFSHISWPVVAVPPLTATLTGVSDVIGETAFSLNFGLDHVAQDIQAIDLTVNFDAVKFEFVEVESLDDKLTVIDSEEIEPGKWRILASAQGIQNVINSNGDLLELKFMVKQLNDASTSIVSLSDMEVSDSEGEITVVNAGDAKSISITPTSLDKTSLNAWAATVVAELNDALEGTLWGKYPVGSKAVLQATLTSAQTASNEATSQTQVDDASQQLQTAYTTFIGLVNTTGSIGDLGVLAAAYGYVSTDVNWLNVKRYDQNQDNKIDIIDIAAIARIILNY